MPKKTKTSAFGVSKREGHDATEFYKRSMFGDAAVPEPVQAANPEPPAGLGEWADRVYCRSAEQLPLPDQSVALAFTSPPYNVGKEYDVDLSLDDYLAFIQRVGREVYRVLKPGGRYVINIANLGRKPYIPLHAFFYKVHMEVGFLPMGEIIWQKGKGANDNCAWGSWKSARSPRLRDLHEYLIVLAKGTFSRPDKGKSDISGPEFMESTLSIWQVQPESAKKVGHPAPFPVELAARDQAVFLRGGCSFRSLCRLRHDLRGCQNAQTPLPGF